MLNNIFIYPIIIQKNCLNSSANSVNRSSSLTENTVKTNKAGLFKGIFFLGGVNPLLYLKKN